jgi:hypothetical protein
MEGIEKAFDAATLAALVASFLHVTNYNATAHLEYNTRIFTKVSLLTFPCITISLTPHTTLLTSSAFQYPLLTLLTPYTPTLLMPPFTHSTPHSTRTAPLHLTLRLTLHLSPHSTPHSTPHTLKLHLKVIGKHAIYVYAVYLILSALVRDHFINEAMKSTENSVCDEQGREREGGREGEGESESARERERESARVRESERARARESESARSERARERESEKARNRESKKARNREP